MSLLGGRTAGGIIKVELTTGGAGYSSPPTVVFSGGGGAGASAVAHMAGTRVESVVITNQGTGYSANPSVSFSGNTTTPIVINAQGQHGDGLDEFEITTSAATTFTTVQQGFTQYSIASWINATNFVASSSLATGAATLSASLGAAALAYAATRPLRPICFFKGRGSDVYGVDGSGRGVRWNGATLQPIGIHKPAVRPSLATVTSATQKYVASIQMVSDGNGYQGVPTVTLEHNSAAPPTRVAKARASISQGRVTRIDVTDPGAGYQATPTVNITGGIGKSAAFTVNVDGSVAGARMVNPGSGFFSTSANVVTVHNTKGLAGAVLEPTINSWGQVVGLNVLNAGSGATTTGQTFSVAGMTGTAATGDLTINFSVASLSVATSGTGYHTPPVITFRPNIKDPAGSGGEAVCTVNITGNVDGATVLQGGQYFLPPTAKVEDTSARAQATLSDNLAGKYTCCYRYLDNTPESEGGPKPSSISDLAEVDAGDAATSITWTFTHYSEDARVAAMELWRTTADQGLLLFRVATIKKTGGTWDASTYTDTVTDKDLIDVTRDGYGLMPIILPSGQVNARRFGVPPGEFAVACNFQDRAWYAVDVLGKRPNAIYFSEIDEPESVPEVNEVILQENTPNPDRIVALIPMGPALYIVQTSHIYKLMYVSQPLIDASLSLAGYRGVLNDRCWTVASGVAFLVDSSGMYAFDGSQEQPVSAAIDNYWRDGLIDLSQADSFHVLYDGPSKTVKFFYARPGDAVACTRALCFCPPTQSWWEETYPVAITAGTPMSVVGKVQPVMGTQSGTILRNDGMSDSGTAIPYNFRSGAMPLNNGPDRSIGVVYKPTVQDSTLDLSLHYNNSPTARPGAISSDRGTGFTVEANQPAKLNMKSSRSALGTATGYARAYYAGRKDDRSSGGDQHLAVAFSGTQATTPSTDRVTMFAISVDGVGDAD